MRTLIITALLLGTTMSIMAQGPRAGRMDPSKMLQREKGAILEHMEDLTDKQKEELAKLYDELALEVDQKMLEAREDHRQQREAFKEKKSTALSSILSEDQFKKYQEMVEQRQKRRGHKNHKEGQGRH